MQIKGIKYIGPMFDNSGYAQATRDNIMALHKAGVPLTVSPMTFEAARPDLGKTGKIINSLVGKNIDYNIVIMQCTPEFWEKHREADKINVGFIFWETTKIHPKWENYINEGVDKLLVACEWNRDVIKKCNITVPIGVVPNGIDPIRNIKPFEIAGVAKDTFMFYSIFQWTERKNPLALIKAYWHAFQNDEDVVLVLKTYRNNYAEDQKDAIRLTLKRLKTVTPFDKYPKVCFVSHMLSNDEIFGLHSRGDCYASLDRGEGFGLSPFIAGAMNKPIIVTGFGGSTEYAKPNNSYLVNYTLEPVFGMPWSPWYKGNQLWAYPDIKHGSDLMRHVYDNRNAAAEKGKLLGDYIRTNFNFDVIGQRLIKELEEI